MKRRVSLVAAAFLAVVSVASLNAQNPDPYANVLESSEYTTFNPAGNFSLQATLAVGESIEARNASGKGFVYTAVKPGVYSFLVNVEAGTAQVYWGGELQSETLQITTSTAPVSVGGDDLVASELQNEAQKVGIYSTKNLLINPGFEKNTGYADGYDETNATDQRGYAEGWFVLDASYCKGATCRNNNARVNTTYTDMLSVIEGDWAFFYHNNNTPLWQKLDKSKLKAGAWYKAAYRQLAHKDTSSPVEYTFYILSDSTNADKEGRNVLASRAYMSPDQGFGNYKDVTCGFKTPDVLPEGDLYYVIRRTGGGCINHFDRMTLQELQNSEVYMNGVIATVPQITWEDGLSAPQGGGSEIYEDVTANYLANPSFETTEVTLAANSKGADEGNSGVWVPQGWTVAYSVIKNNPDVWDQGLITSGQSGYDHNNNRTTDTGYRSTDGENFYYFRTRWTANQDFKISQTISNLPVGRYDLNFSAAADVPSPATVSISGGSVAKTLQVANAEVKTYTITFNLTEPADMDLSVAVSRLTDAQARLVLDNFRLVSRGGVDNEEVIGELKEAITTLYNELSQYEDETLPNGVLKDKTIAVGMAENVINNGAELTIEELRAVVAACRKAVDEAKECGTLLPDLTNALEYAMSEDGLDEHSDYEGYSVYMDAFDKGSAVIDPYSETLYYAADLQAAMEELAAARRVFYVSSAATATETDPVDLTQVISCPAFTKLYGDATLDADRSKGDWKTDNGGAAGDYKLHTINGQHCWNNWSNNFQTMDLYQELEGMPEGMYMLECETTTEQAPHGQHAYIKTLGGTIESQTTDYYYTGSSFTTESEWQPLATGTIYAPEGSTIRIGMASTSGGGASGWFCATNFKLTYYKATAGAAREALDAQKDLAAELLADSAAKIMGREEALLKNAIQQADAATSETMSAAFKAISLAIDTAYTSISLYNKTGIDALFAQAEEYLAQAGYPERMKVVYRAAIEEQQGVLTNDTTSCRAFAGIKEAMEKALYDYRLSAVEVATPAAPADMTFLLTNPDFENSPYDNGWTNKGFKENTAQVTADEGFSGTKCAEQWVSTGILANNSISQEAWVPDGTYTLSVALKACRQNTYYIYEADGITKKDSVLVTTPVKGVYLFANDDSLEVATPMIGSNGVYENAIPGHDTWPYSVRKEISGVVVAGGRINVGIKTLSTTASWVVVDDFRLYCTQSDYHVDIEDVNAGDDAKALTVYVENGYVKVVGADEFEIISISGAKVSSDTQLAPGFYLVTSGTKSAKIVVE